MKALKRTAIILALGLAAGGCSVIEYKTVARVDLKNAQGHVIGYKDVVRERTTGEELAQIALFVPRVGGRWLDVRSGKGLMIVVHGKNSERVAMAEAPSIDELIHLARLTN